MSLQTIVSYLVCKKGSLPGKKAFQKFMYFIDAKGVPTPLNFRIHHFGPYSRELDYATENLEIEGAITVTKNPSGQGFIITPGIRSEKWIESGQEFLKKYKEVIDDVLSSLPNDVKILELWSTTHFVANAMNKFYDGASKEKVIDEVVKIKQDKFSKDEIAKAYDELMNLNFLQ